MNNSSFGHIVWMLRLRVIPGRRRSLTSRLTDPTSDPAARRTGSGAQGSERSHQPAEPRPVHQAGGKPGPVGDHLSVGLVEGYLGGLASGLCRSEQVVGPTQVPLVVDGALFEGRHLPFEFEDPCL